MDIVFFSPQPTPGIEVNHIQVNLVLATARRRFLDVDELDTLFSVFDQLPRSYCRPETTLIPRGLYAYTQTRYRDGNVWDNHYPEVGAYTRNGVIAYNYTQVQRTFMDGGRVVRRVIRRANQRFKPGLIIDIDSSVPDTLVHFVHFPPA